MDSGAHVKLCVCVRLVFDSYDRNRIMKRDAISTLAMEIPSPECPKRKW